MKVTITKVSVKEGTNAKGNYTRYGIQTVEHGDKWLGCFTDKYNSEKLSSLKEGQVVDIVVKQNGDFINFAFPSKVDLLEERVKVLEQAVLNRSANSAQPPATSTQEDNDW